jgi:hypothetical protein
MSGDLFIPPIIGITGKAGAGKDTLAKILSHNYGYVQYSLADPIKDLLNARFGWTPRMWDNREWKERPATADGFSPRSWAQWLGTEIGRELAGPDVWVNALLVRAAAEGNNKLTVVSDVRFDNEARVILEHGGIVIEVFGRETSAVDQHVSEAGVCDMWIDYRVYNGGEPSDMGIILDGVLHDWSRRVGSARA